MRFYRVPTGMQIYVYFNQQGRVHRIKFVFQCLFGIGLKLYGERVIWPLPNLRTSPRCVRLVRYQLLHFFFFTIVFIRRKVRTYKSDIERNKYKNYLNRILYAYSNKRWSQKYVTRIIYDPLFRLYKKLCLITLTCKKN